MVGLLESMEIQVVSNVITGTVVVSSEFGRLLFCCHYVGFTKLFSHRLREEGTGG
jgi:hypothetical protein